MPTQARRVSPDGYSENDARAERVFLSLIERNAAQGRYFTAMLAPRELSAMPGCDGLSKRVLKQAMERLFAGGKLVQITVRENRRDRTVISVNAAL